MTSSCPARLPLLFPSEAVKAETPRFTASPSPCRVGSMQLLEYVQCLLPTGSLLNHIAQLGQLLASRSDEMAPSPQEPVPAVTARTAPLSQASKTVAPPLCSDDSQMASPPASTPATASSKTPRPVRRRRIVRILRPEPGSIYDIMHDNQGESLYQYPICWTDAHARLLNVDFIDQPHIRKPVPDFRLLSSNHPPRPSRVATQLSKDLTSILDPSAHFDTTAMTQVMGTFFPATLSNPASDVDLELRFGARTLKRAVHVAALWTHPLGPSASSFESAATKPASAYGRIPTTDSQARTGPAAIDSLPRPPILAFVNRLHLAEVRRCLYRVSPGPRHGDRQNTPVLNLQKLRAKRLVPKVSDRDSYLVAIMLAIAQSQFYPPPVSSRSSSQKSAQKSSRGSIRDSQATTPPLEFRDVPVRILSQDCDTSDFVVYTATVTTTFLKRFADPSKAPTADALHNTGLKVHVTRVSVWPVLGLKERLAQALGSEISGEDPTQVVKDSIVTWEPGSERSIRGIGLKRSRDALSEVCDAGRTPLFSVPSPGSGASVGVAAASPTASPRAPKRRRTDKLNGLEVC